MKTGKQIQNEFAQYIVDSVESDGALYKRIYRPIVKDYARKKLSGIYDQEKAIKGVMPLVVMGIKKYTPEAEHYYGRKFDGVLKPGIILRQQIAVELLEGMQGEINDLVREKNKPKRMGNFTGTFKQSNMSGECWAVQFQGKEACKKCEFRGTKECGGKRIIKTGKTAKGKTVPLKRGKFGDPSIWERSSTPETHTTSWRNKNTGAKVSVVKDRNAGGYPCYAINKEGHGYSGFTVTGKKSTVKKDIKDFMKSWKD